MAKSTAIRMALLALLAAGACSTVTEKDVLLADTHRDLAEMKLARGEPEAAIAEYQKSLSLDPRDADTHFGLAEAYRRKGLLADTERELREARLHRWNKLRKIRKPDAPASSLGDTGELVLPELTPIPPGLEISPDELSVPAPPPVPDLPEIETSAADVVADPPSDPDADTSLVQPEARSAVLGRISLVRRGGADARRLEQLARLLAFF